MLRALIRVPITLTDLLFARAYRPVVTLLWGIERSSRAEYQWQTLSAGAQFRVEPPLPHGWVRVRLRGRATHPTPIVLRLEDSEAEERVVLERLGTLGRESSTLSAFLYLGRATSIRIETRVFRGPLTIEDLAFEPVGIWRVALRALSIYVRRPERRQRNPWSMLRRAYDILRLSGLAGLRTAMRAQFTHGREIPTYEAWLQARTISDSDRVDLREALERVPHQPTISLLMPAVTGPPDLIARSIDSVRDQIYERWELLIAQDVSAPAEVRSLVDAYAKKDGRVKIFQRGHGRALTEAAEFALSQRAGEFIALLREGDEISVDALLENVLMVNEVSDADLIYSDEDRIDETGRRNTPYFKPDWSPETLLAQMYLGGLCLYRRTAVVAAGGLLAGADTLCDHDLALRVTGRADRVQHIAKVLYHRRSASDAEAQEARGASVDAVRRALDRRGIRGRVDAARGQCVVRIEPDRSQRVSIVIPTRDRADLLGECLDSVFRLTRHPNFEVCVVDNGSRERETLELLERWKSQESARFNVVRQDIPFNFSTLVNAGVAATRGELIVLLNNDTEVISPEWMDDMAGFAQLADIGAVGCTLLFKDNTIQHAGVILMAGAVAGHSHAGLPDSAAGYFGRLVSQSNYAAVTAACLMVRRTVFEEVHGFDEQLGVAYNDVDFCLRMLERGYRNVCLGQVRLFHDESRSRGLEDTREKQQRYAAEWDTMRKRWRDLIDRDPYYNPNLRSIPPDFALLM